MKEEEEEEEEGFIGGGARGGVALEVKAEECQTTWRTGGKSIHVCAWGGGGSGG